MPNTLVQLHLRSLLAGVTGPTSKRVGPGGLLPTPLLYSIADSMLFQFVFVDLFPLCFIIMLEPY